MNLRTASLCVALAGMAYAGAAWMTQNFQVWTAEGARRLIVTQQPVPAPVVEVEGPQLPRQSLRTLLADGKGATIINFIYTRCRTVCLASGGVLGQMQQTLARSDGATAASVRLLSISFQQEYDSVDVLRKYAQHFGADPVIWRFARTTDVAQQQRLLRDFQVVVIPDGRGEFEHNAALLVVGPDGHLRRIFDTLDAQAALDYAVSLTRGQT